MSIETSSPEPPSDQPHNRAEGDEREASLPEKSEQALDASSWRDLTRKAQRFDAGLYLAATPIGNLRDITLRVLDALSGADRILAEDTRQTRRLLDAYDIKAALHAYHEHNAESLRPSLIEAIKAGERIVLVTDAGTPLVSDPGYKLARTVIDEGLMVSPLPGASAALAGLCISGLPSDRFLFAGFPPSKQGARVRWYQDLKAIGATLIMYEAPQRLKASLADAYEVFGPRDAVIARELTKLYEEARRGSLKDLADYYAQAGNPKGEIVLMIAPPDEREGEWDQDRIDAALRLALEEQGPSGAAAQVAKASGVKKKVLYQRALELKGQ